VPLRTGSLLFATTPVEILLSLLCWAVFPVRQSGFLIGCLVSQVITCIDLSSSLPQYAALTRTRTSSSYPLFLRPAQDMGTLSLHVPQLAIDPAREHGAGASGIILAPRLLDFYQPSSSIQPRQFAQMEDRQLRTQHHERLLDAPQSTTCQRQLREHQRSSFVEQDCVATQSCGRKADQRNPSQSSMRMTSNETTTQKPRGEISFLEQALALSRRVHSGVSRVVKEKSSYH